MKYKLLMAIGLGLVGCASAPPPAPNPTYSFGTPPVVPVILDPRAQQMSRQEVIQASIDCESNNLRAVPIMSKRMVSGMLSDIIIDVQCMPKRNMFDGKF